MKVAFLRYALRCLSQEELFVIFVVNFGDKGSRCESEQESDAVEDYVDWRLYSRVRQILLTALPRVVLVAIAHLFLADSRIVAVVAASLVVLVVHFPDLSGE